MMATVLRTTLPLVALVISAGHPTFAQAPAPSSVSDTFELSVCNDTDKNIRSMIYYLDNRIGSWVLSGWNHVQPKQCDSFTKYARKGVFYYHVTQDGTSSIWGGPDRKICVSHRATYRMIYKDEKCLAGERIEGFQEQKVDDETFVLRLSSK